MIFSKKYSFIGTIVLCLAILVVSLVSIFAPKPSLIETKGTITEIVEDYDPTMEEYTHTVYITYRANGKKYEHAEFGSYNSSMKVGDKVVVLFDQKNPEHIEAEDSETVPYITAAVSGVILIGCVVLMIKKRAA